MICNTYEEFSLKWIPILKTIQKYQEILFDQTPDTQIDQILPQILPGFSESEYFPYQIIASISILFFSHYELTEFCADLLVALKPHICKAISEKRFLYLIQNKYFLLRLYQEKAITPKQLLKAVTSLPESELLYFHDILKIEDPREYEKKYHKLFEPFLTPKFLDTFEECRSKGLNNDPLALAIRYDNLNDLQTLMSTLNIPINSKIPISIFERSQVFIATNGARLIEYAAYYGSINCFKFLLMSGAEMSDDLISYAIFGSNYEIIHILEDHHVPLEFALRTSICVHKPELIDYFRDSHSLDVNDLTICCSINNYNISSLLPFLEQIYNNPNLTNDAGFPIINNAISHNHIDIIDMLFSIPAIDVNYTTDSSMRTPLELAIFKKNYLVFNKLMSMPKITVQREKAKISIISGAIVNNCFPMVKKIVEHDTFVPLTLDIISKTELHIAIQIQRNDIFKYLVNHQKYTQIMKSYLAFFVVYAALNNNWDIADYLIDIAKSCDNILAYLKKVSKTNPQSESNKAIYAKIREKVERRRNVQPLIFRPPSPQSDEEF